MRVPFFEPLPETTNTHELLRRIELKDNKFRFAQAVFFGLITIGLIVVLILGYQTQRSNTKLLNTAAGLAKQQKFVVDGLKTASDKNAQQIKDLQTHIDCIVALLQQPNRTNLVISDIENCQITPSSSGGASSVSKSSSITVHSTPSNSPATQPSPSPAPQPKSQPLVCSLTLKLLGCN